MFNREALKVVPGQAVEKSVHGLRIDLPHAATGPKYGVVRK
jgi:hypothetical protein